MMIDIVEIDDVMIRSIVDFEKRTMNRTNAMRKELEYLNQKECEIIMKLRTEFINLNHYLHHINFHPDGLCDHCGVKETVTHYLIDCVGFHKSVELSLHKDNVDFIIPRNRMRKRLKRIAIFFRTPANFTTKNILFPHLWQGNPKFDKSNKSQYQEKVKNNLDKRVEILKCVINFVRETKRFKNNFGY